MLKKYCLVFSLLAILVGYSGIFGQERNLGAGLKLGEPTGITLKYWLNQSNALDFTLGFSVFNSNSRVNINLNYLYHYYGIINKYITTQEDVNLFLGFGARLVTKAHGNSSIGVRGVGGTAWNMKNYPVEVFLEAAPVFRLFPTAGIDFDMSIGARYYFK